MQRVLRVRRLAWRGLHRRPLCVVSHQFTRSTMVPAGPACVALGLRRRGAGESTSPTRAPPFKRRQLNTASIVFETYTILLKPKRTHSGRPRPRASGQYKVVGPGRRDAGDAMLLSKREPAHAYRDTIESPICIFYSTCDRMLV
jgi:hypothetical protein